MKSIIRTVLLMAVMLSTSTSHSEVVLDGTMGRSGAVAGPNYSITNDLGKQLGGNLFHSFSSFNLIKNESATFSGPNTVQNIISRVTGGNRSSINGTIRSEIPNADLYLINPSGIVFGQDAKLDMGGSFHANTADYLKLSDGGRFDAKTPANSLLTVAAPSAFGFLSDTPKGISVDGSFLKVPEGKTLSMIGGNLTIQNGTLYAPSGTINLVSVASRGEAIVSGDNFQTDSFSNMGNISINDTRQVSERLAYDFKSDAHIGNADVSGSDSAGGIFIRGNSFVLDNGWLFSDTYGSGSAIGIDIKLREDLSASNNSLITSDTLGSGQGGNILIDVQKLALSGSGICSNVWGEGNGGIVSVTSPIVTMDDGTWIQTATVSSGNAGETYLNTGKLSMTGLASINGSSYSTGKGGTINIKASEAINLSKGMVKNCASKAGDGGTIFIKTPSLLIGPYSSIDGSTSGTGKGGSIFIDAGMLTSDHGVIDASSYSGGGDSGNININAYESVYLANFSYIRNQIFSGSSGNGGKISIFTPSLLLYNYGQIDGSFDGDNSAKTGSSIFINSGKIDLYNSSLITTTTSSTGNGGNIYIDANESLLLSDSNIYAETDAGGRAGDISIHSGYVDLAKGGIYTTTWGTGTGGSIFLNVDKLTANDSNIWSESTGSGKAGNTIIQASGAVDVSNSQIWSAAGWEGGDGGNISITAGSLSVANDSWILSWAEKGGNAGNINISAAGAVTLSGGRIDSSAAYNGSGAGGNISIKASSFSLDKGEINVGSFGSGNAGIIDIDVGTLELKNYSEIDVYSGESGKGGDLTIKASGSVSMMDSEILGAVWGSGNGGKISIKSPLLQMNGASIYANKSGSGDGEAILLEVGRLSLSEGSLITLKNFNDFGQGGSLNINATESVMLSRSAISGTKYGEGDGAGIIITSPLLSMNQSGLATSNYGGGKGGDIYIKTVDATELSGFEYQDGPYSSTIVSETFGKGNAGNITIETGRLTVTDIGRISTSAGTGSEGTGGNITIKATDSVSVRGSYESADGGLYASNIKSETFGKGDAGNIAIETGKLNIMEAGRISTSARTGSEGAGGNITIKATDSILVRGSYESTDGGLYASGITSETFGKGNAGNIIIETGKLNILEVGGISTNAREGSEGAGGNISIKTTDSVLIDGNYEGADGGVYLSDITSNTSGRGNAGNISIATGKLTITDAGRISTSAGAGSEGAGGNITITATDSVLIHGNYESADGYLYLSGVKSETYGKGNAGNVTVETNSLSLFDSGKISTSATSSSEGTAGNVVVLANIIDLKGNASLSSASTGTGNAGSVNVKAIQGIALQDSSINTSSQQADGGSIKISSADISLNDNSSIRASVAGGSGKGGSVEISAASLGLGTGSKIESSTGGTGKGGSVTVNITDRIDIAGTGTKGNSGLFSTASGSGAAGVINVATPLLNLSDGGQINVSTSGSGMGGDIGIDTPQLNISGKASILSESTGTGIAGSVAIKAKDAITLTDSSITTATRDADGGNIFIDPQMVRLTNSEITATVKGGTGNGGNISVVADNIVLDKSRIIANAEGGNGGNINLTSKVFLKTPESVISASSRLGLQGNVMIAAPLVDVSGNIVDLHRPFLDANSMFPKLCAESEEDLSTFVLKGRDGLPLKPGGLLMSP